MKISTYIHIPFCKTRCTYCDFCSYPNVPAHRRLAYAGDVCREALFYAANLPPHEVGTVYFGGGTPSLMPAAGLWKMLATLREHMNLAPDAEITLEANPDSVTPQACDGWLGMGINRLSLGIQAVQDDMLRTLGRAHTHAQSQAALHCAQQAGFANVSMDGMVGLPGQSMAMWQDTLDFLAQADHVSCYTLEVHADTPLGCAVAQGLALPNEDDTADMMLEAHQRLAARGFTHYEVSNFAKEGGQSRHNMGYWARLPYIGLGAGAHGFLPTQVSLPMPHDPLHVPQNCLRTVHRFPPTLRVNCSTPHGNSPASRVDAPALYGDSPALHAYRYENIGDLTTYAEAVAQTGHGRKTTDPVTPEDAIKETVMLALRTHVGLELAAFERDFGKSPITDAQHARWVKEGICQPTPDRLALTPKGFLINNAVISAVWDNLGL